MILGVDHLILAIERADRPHFSQRLRSAGLIHADAGRHVGQGTANENLALAGGSYLELLFPDPPPEPPEGWFEPVPRILGVCFTSTDLDADSAAWVGDAGAWTQDLRKTLADGTDVRFRLGGPHPRDEGPFFLFLLEREAPAFPDLGAAARLERLTLTGADAAAWLELCERWLGLEREGDTLRAGGVELGFQADGRPGLAVNASFAVPEGEGVLPLAAGRIELRGP